MERAERISGNMWFWGSPERGGLLGRVLRGSFWFVLFGGGVGVGEGGESELVAVAIACVCVCVHVRMCVTFLFCFVVWSVHRKDVMVFGVSYQR